MKSQSPHPNNHPLCRIPHPHPSLLKRLLQIPIKPLEIRLRRQPPTRPLPDKIRQRSREILLVQKRRPARRFLAGLIVELMLADEESEQIARPL